MTGSYLASVGLGLSLAGGLFGLSAAGIVVRRGFINWKGNSKFSRTATDSTLPNMGLARLAPQWAIAVYFLVLMMIPTTIALAKYFYRYPIYTLTNVQVLTFEPATNGYWMEYQSESFGRLKFFAHMCEAVPFDPGDYLKLLKYEDRNSCWSLKSEYAGVLIRRDAEGRTDSERRALNVR